MNDKWKRRKLNFGSPVIWIDANGGIRKGVVEKKQFYAGNDRVTILDSNGFLAHPLIDRVAYNPDREDHASDDAKMAINVIALLKRDITRLQEQVADGSEQASVLDAASEHLATALARIHDFIDLRNSAIDTINLIEGADVL